MLQAFRGRAASWIAKILFSLLALSFIGWGATDYLVRGPQAGPVIEVGSTKLEAPLAQRIVGREIEVLGRQMPGLDREQLKRLGLVDQAVEQVVSRIALDQEVERLGLAVSDEALRRTLTGNPAFRAPGGGFDRARFNAVINQMGYTEQGFLNEFRKDMVRSYLARGLATTGKAPGAIVDPLLKYRGESRTPELAVSLAGNPDALPAPTAEELKKFYDDNSNRFTTAERRKVSLLLLSIASIKAEIAVTDQEVIDSFEARKAELTSFEKRHVVQVLVNDEAKAKAIAEAAKDGDLAKAATDNGAQVTELGTITQTELPKALGDAAFALAENAVSAPIQAEFGWTIVKVLKIEPKVEPNFETLKAQIADDIKTERGMDKLYERSNKLDETLANGASLPDAAAAAGLKLEEIPVFDRRGLSDTGEILTGLPGRNRIIDLAFQTPSGETSRLIELPEGTVAALRVDAIEATSVRPFDAVKADAEILWRVDIATKAARVKAEAMLAEIKAGKSFDEAAANAGLTIEEKPAVTREGAGAGDATVSAQVLAALFGLAKVGDSEIADLPNGAAVVRLKSINAAEADKLKVEREALSSELSDGIGGDAALVFQQYLRQRYPVAIDKARLDSLF
ncbi:SurA N-terminal domain-containing protein [Lacibacterium aquatile]|uniref:Parvulin-like PPIase n=1 Tax=Lacibacterium aquatile TaxID=1168082 RepID=A0ABW5DTY1_9PROT